MEAVAEVLLVLLHCDLVEKKSLRELRSIGMVGSSTVFGCEIQIDPKLLLTAGEENRCNPNIGEKLDIYKLKIQDSYLSL
jgi:hypothetical protein